MERLLSSRMNAHIIKSILDDGGQVVLEASNRKWEYAGIRLSSDGLKSQYFVGSVGGG